MCGICGEVTFNGAAAGGSLAAMTQKMWPRGPDAGGTFSQNSVAFGHRRLSIIDLGAASQQPMIDPELGLAIVFNGCIYNYRDLRNELSAKGYRFFSQGDTEVILKAYAEWGPRCVERFHGMFAFAVWERDSGRLVLARDRLGIKPLYYTEGHGRFRFASTLPALLAAGGVDTTIDPAALHHYLSWHAVVPAPMTIIKGVRKLPPATICTIEADGRCHEDVYWQLEVGPRSADRGRTEADWREEVQAVLGKAVDRRRVADVPVGVLLSGGLDSSLLVALLAKLGQTDIKTFSVGFETIGDVEGDEFHYSDLIADQFATDHHRIRVDGARAIHALPGMVAAMSEPMMSHDAIGFYLLSQEVAKYVKVAQSGQGADEIFGGYHWYPVLMRSNDATEDYARVYFDRDHAEMAELVAPDLMNGDYSRDFVEFVLPRLPQCEPDRSNAATRRPDHDGRRSGQAGRQYGDGLGLGDSGAVSRSRSGRAGGTHPGRAQGCRRRQVHSQGSFARPGARRGDRPAEGLFPGAGAKIYPRGVSRLRSRRSR